MPGVLIIFFVSIGLGGISALTDSQSRVWSGPDSSSHSKGKLPTAVSYSISTNYPFTAVAEKDLYGVEECHVTVIVTHSGKRPLRLQLDGEEQNLGAGWLVDRTVKANQHQQFQAVFLNPVGGAVVAIRSTSIHCTKAQVESTRNQILFDERGLRGYTAPDCPCAH